MRRASAAVEELAGGGDFGVLVELPELGGVEDGVQIDLDVGPACGELGFLGGGVAEGGEIFGEGGRAADQRGEVGFVDLDADGGDAAGALSGMLSAGPSARAERGSSVSSVAKRRGRRFMVGIR